MKNLLYLEDDQSFHRPVSYFIEKTGKEAGQEVKVTIKENLEDAVQSMQEQDYDFYIVDGNFPRKKGEGPGLLCFEFYEAVKTQYPDQDLTKKMVIYSVDIKYNRPKVFSDLVHMGIPVIEKDRDTLLKYVKLILK
jgi:DNA-binding NarL/FixJ family response regulator